MAGLRAEAPATNAPPGPVAMPSATNVQPQTPAPPQAAAKSARGAQSPNGANGLDINHHAVTKGPNSPAHKPTPAGAPPTGANPVAVVAPETGAHAPAPPPAAQKAGTVLDHYLQDLDNALHLSADEKKDIQTYYLQDGPALQGIMNNDVMSPCEQARQVAQVRDRRNDKIEALLADDDRRRDFLNVEKNYRVALTVEAANGALNPAQPPPAAPAPSDIKPGDAEQVPQTNNGDRPSGA